VNSFPFPPSPVQSERDAAVSALRDILAVYGGSEGGESAICVRMGVIARAALARLGELTPPCPADAYDFGGDPTPDGDESGIDLSEPLPRR
jgi:hypothetical protein